MTNGDSCSKKDRIPVDLVVGRPLDHTTGIGRFVQEIVANYTRVDPRIIDFRPPSYLRPAAKVGSLAYFPHKVRSQSRKDSVLHFTSQIQAHVLNFYRLRPSVVTCHDFFPAISSEHPISDRVAVRLGLRGLLRADKICSVSHYVKEELQKHLPIDPSKIEVIHSGVDHRRYVPFSDREKVRHAIGLPTKKIIFLYVGSEQPRKNLPLLMRALGHLKKMGLDFILVKIGIPQWKGGRKQTLEAAKRNGVDDKILLLDSVNEIDMPKYYQSADAFAFPSLYEGFGLPLLEAMACGCPVLALRRTSIPEVVGDAGILVEEDNPVAFAEALAKIVEDDDLKKKLSSKGIARSSQFSWEVAAQKYEDIYEQLLGGDC